MKDAHTCATKSGKLPGLKNGMLLRPDKINLSILRMEQIIRRGVAISLVKNNYLNKDCTLPE